jgi:hypothetical protein
MYKVAQEFTFTVIQNEYTYNFTGQLVFSSRSLNEIGTLHTEDELSNFGVLLNTSLAIPEYWTLELLAQHLFIHARPVFQNLDAVNLWLTDQPQRVAEFNGVGYDFAVDGDILELEAVG